jgi:hypothetical protein
MMDDDMSAISDRWLLRGGPNGGYVAAVAIHAMRAAADGRDPLSATVHYVSPAEVGPFEALVRTLGARRRHATVQADLVQGGVVRAAAIATFADLGPAAESRIGLGPPRLPDVADSVPVPIGRLAPGSFEERLERRAPSSEVIGFITEGVAGPPEVGGWTRLRDDPVLGICSVPIMMDSWPPPPHRAHGAQGRATTVDLTVHWRGRPQGDWHYVWFESRLLQHGYVEIDGRLWRPDGALVAQSRQLARYRPPE